MPPSLKHSFHDYEGKVPVQQGTKKIPSSTLPSSSITIPDDIILEIAKLLSARDLLQLSLQSKHVFLLLQSSLYSYVRVDHADACRTTLKTFRKRPDLTEWIKVLDLSLIQRSGWATYMEKSIDENWAAQAIEDMASEGSLPLLRSFKWRGLESPNDTLWLALRLGCPQLRIVGTTVGKRTHIINPDSNLFDFRGLKGFHLSTLVLERWEAFRKHDSFPQRLWDMLLVHSPDLEELTLDATVMTEDVWLMNRVLEGRWPKLRRISIGNMFKVQELGDPRCGVLFNSFLNAHPTLEEFDSYGTIIYNREDMITVLSLPRIHRFRGKLQQLKAADACVSTVRELELTDWFSPAANLHDILKHLPQVISLSICLNFLDKQGSQQSFFDRLFKNCTSELRNLEISSTSTLNIRELFDAMLQAPNLRLSAFSITHVQGMRISDTDVKSAILLAKRMRHLQEFVIRDVSSWNHYDQLNSVYSTGMLRRFIVQSNECLQLQESGIGRLGQKYTKSMMYSLSSG
ncbi:hypothetical protein VNI00_007817 [Paramarasmius palmivorus]|uniref:F-box domain-containing protein n=1 Tax=Paramarasmius palmivorus TaxID=297713 RepID=A0AAW0CXN5_9AGAR